MKAILVIDLPKCCGETPCPCWNDNDRKDWCGATNMTLTGSDIEKERPSWCPLKPMPEKKEETFAYWIARGGNDPESYINGWNDCVVEILKNEKKQNR